MAKQDVSAITPESWHIPLSCGDITLRSAIADLQRIGDEQATIPLVVRLVENPAFRLPGLEVFHGAADLRTHDSIHVLLGRGVLPKDEAFVIGFTMGSTKRMWLAEEASYTWIARHLYPGEYRFDEENVEVFRNAVRLGFVSDCLPLNLVSYQNHLDRSLRDVRRALGIEEDLLNAYYRIEMRRYPESPESQRLLDGWDETPRLMAIA